MMARVAAATDEHGRTALAPAARQLSGILAALADNLDDHATRQGAADRALEVVRRFVTTNGEAAPASADVLTAVQMVAADIMTFAGVDHDDAISAVRAGTGQFNVPPPPPAPRLPFGPLGLTWPPASRLRSSLPGLHWLSTIALPYALSRLRALAGWLRNRPSSRRSR